jgi:hypothetical protein
VAVHFVLEARVKEPDDADNAKEKQVDPENTSRSLAGAAVRADVIGADPE